MEGEKGVVEIEERRRERQMMWQDTKTIEYVDEGLYLCFCSEDEWIILLGCRDITSFAVINVNSDHEKQSVGSLQASTAEKRIEKNKFYIFSHYNVWKSL